MIFVENDTITINRIFPIGEKAVGGGFEEYQTWSSETVLIQYRLSGPHLRVTTRSKER